MLGADCPTNDGMLGQFHYQLSLIIATTDEHVEHDFD